ALPGLAGAFNLDTDNAISWSGETGSLFGFSLAMHRQLQPQEKRLLLVGAPREKAFPAQQANRTGGLYSCDIASPNTNCMRIKFDEERRTARRALPSVGTGVQHTETSHMISCVLQTCAHRYEKRQYVNTVQETRDIIGRCYVLSQDLTIKDDMDNGVWSFCDGRLRGHEKFGSCQQGVAATFTRDYHYIVFGAPGTYNWKGVVRAEQKNQTFYDLGIFDDGPYEVGDESRQDKNLVPVPANSYLGLLFLTAVSDTHPDQFVYKTLPPSIQVDKSVDVMMNSYLGFSLDSGKGIVSQDEMTFVSGAPRANHSGAVVLLKKEKNQRALSLEHIFEGEGLASSFGYDVAVVDLNSDGYGCESVRTESHDLSNKEFYLNSYCKQRSRKPVSYPRKAIEGPCMPKNDFRCCNLFSPDIAVGAPYDGFGKVYIYHGSENGINTKPAQILDGEKTNTNFFGYSIAGNMDLDKNSYPDVAVGSLSDSVNVYRSRPVISIRRNITLILISWHFFYRMDVKACFKYTANPRHLNPRIKVNYTFEVENERRKLGLPSRVRFHDHSSDQFTASTTLRGQNSWECVTTKLILQEKIKDKLRPIPISVSVKIAGLESPSRRRESALPDLIPILNSNESETETTKVEFLKEGCGEDNECHSNLKLQYRFCTREGNEDRFTYLPLENGMPVLVLKDQKDIALEITVTNNPSDVKNPQKDGEDAYEAKLIATFPDSLTYSAFREMRGYPEKQLTCGANQNGSQAECELGNPFKRNSNVTFYLILSTTKVSVDTTDLDINLKLETTSTQVNLTPIAASAKVVLELLLSLTGVAKPSQVYFGGNIVGESAMKSEDDIGSLIEYEFRVTNLGRPLKTFGTASLDIQWPKEISNGKWLLYLMKIDSKGLEKVSCQPKKEINSLDKCSLCLESHNSRRKREVAEKQITDSQAFSLFSERKYKTLSCSANARCVDIKCPLKGLDSKASIVLRSRLWNATFLEEYSKMNYLDIVVRASISVPAAAKNVKLTNEVAQVRVTVFPAKPVALYSGVPWWIIAVAILAGILMLALLVFLLWKCGFFRRSRYEDSVPRYHAVRIRKEERQIKDEKSQDLETKQWFTKWNENESYS
ncbi:ITA6 protein, partial [Oxylabes madagascariensis]|nr:ITA6 protein [Oxylabes madagascariensis]